MRIKNINLIFLILLFSSSLIISIYLLFDDIGIFKSTLPLLPLFFSFSILLFFNISSYIFNKISITLIIGLYYMKMVVVPLFMGFSNYESSFIIVYYETLFDKAILLTLYEYLLVIFIISFYARRIFRTNLKMMRPLEVKFSEVVNYRKLNWFIIISLLILGIIMIYPEILNNYRFILILNEDYNISWYRNYLLTLQSVPLIIFYLVTWIIDVFENIWAIILILYSTKLFNKTPYIGIVLSALIILFTALFSSENSAYSLFFAISLSIILIFIYPNYTRLIILSITLVLLSVVGFGLFSISMISNSGMNDGFSNFSSILQAYFSGPNNLAVSLMINRDSSIYYMYVDFMRSIPFVKSYYTDLISSTNAFNSILYQNNNSGGQIIPAVGLGYIYFGSILSPIFSIIFVYFALKTEVSFIKEKNILLKFFYVFLTIIFSVTPVLYNSYIFTIGLFQFIIPTYLVIRLLKRKKLINKV